MQLLSLHFFQDSRINTSMVPLMKCAMINGDNIWSRPSCQTFLIASKISDLSYSQTIKYLKRILTALEDLAGSIYSGGKIPGRVKGQC